MVRPQEAGLLEAGDETHLQYARRERLVLVTQDADFLRLDRQGITHAGIAYFEQGRRVGAMVLALTLMYETMSAGEMADHIEYW